MLLIEKQKMIRCSKSLILVISFVQSYEIATTNTKTLYIVLLYIDLLQCCLSTRHRAWNKRVIIVLDYMKPHQSDKVR